jgi:DNA repair protein RecN (Recombination protein N)
VRTGAERATVEAVFDVGALPAVARLVEELGFRLEDGLLILRREVAAEGRNRAWVCGSPATAGVVGELGSTLVDLHGQHEHQTLLRPRDQRAVLDSFGEAEEAAARVAALYGELQELRHELEAREEHLRDVESRADFLRFQLSEIDEARPLPGEDDALEAELGRHEHSEELMHGAASVHDGLYDADESITDRLAAALRTLSQLAEYDPELRAEAELLSEALHAATEVGRRMGGYASSIDHDPERLEEVRARLDRLFRLKRKYGPELADVLATAQRVREELGALEDADHDLDVFRGRIGEVEGQLGVAANELSDLRRAAAAGLSESAAAVLPKLGLPGASFEVRLTRRGMIAAGGAESVEFLVATNQGFEPMPLARIASGGELSRVMLALKSILAGVDQVPVLVFDEIDAGIGGVVAGAVADELAEVATRHQVFVVTHLAQVASRAASHLLVEKGEGEGITSTSVRPLEGEPRIYEIARMLGGDPESSTSREHARELLGA